MTPLSHTTTKEKTVDPQVFSWKGSAEGFAALFFLCVGKLVNRKLFPLARSSGPIMISNWSAVLGEGGNKTLLQVMELLKVTNIRIEFLKLHTLGDDHIDSSMGTSDSSKKYYYALYNLVLRGSCFCYGHASSCRPLNGDESTAAIPGMVHGRCDCEHFTTGMNCEKCMDFYHDAPWRPAKAGDTSKCRRKYTSISLAGTN